MASEVAQAVKLLRSEFAPIGAVANLTSLCQAKLHYGAYHNFTFCYCKILH